MRLLSYVLKRFFYIVPVLIGVTLLVFIISHAIPGDPARMMAGQKASREAVENIRRSLGLDRPLPEQYARYLVGLLKGDLGRSIRNQRPVLDDLKDFFPATLELTIVSMIFCIGVGLPLGILSAIRRNHPIDHTARVFSVIGVSMPVFWLGLMLLLLFYRNLGWLPGSGRLDVGFNPPAHVTGMYLIDTSSRRGLAEIRQCLLSHHTPGLLSLVCLSGHYHPNRPFFDDLSHGTGIHYHSPSQWHL